MLLAFGQLGRAPETRAVRLHAQQRGAACPAHPRAPPLLRAARPEAPWRFRRLVVAGAGAPPPPPEPSPANPPCLPAPGGGSGRALTAPEPAVRAYHTLRGKLVVVYQMYGKSTLTAVRAFLGGPDWWTSRQKLEDHEQIGRNLRFTAAMNEDIDRLLQEREARKKRKTQRGKVAPQSGKAAPRPKDGAAAPAPADRPAPLVWAPPPADAAPAAASARMAAAEASAAAAAAWAKRAAGREAAAEAVGERGASQPAAEHKGDAEAWEWAAQAWHAAHEALEAARQACPDSPAVHEAEAALQAARALKAQRQKWRDS